MLGTKFAPILIALICFQVSCDSFVDSTVLHRTLRKLKFRVAEISELYPARLERSDALFLHDLNKAPTEPEVKEIQDFVSAGGTLIVAGDDPSLDGLFSVYGLKLRELPENQEFSHRIPDDPFFPQRPVDEIRVRTNFVLEKRYYTLETRPPNPFVALVFGTRGGLAAVYICSIVFIFLVMRGRRFGKPLDVQEKSRRLSSEYVHAMTALYQKGNTRSEILRHIRDTFRSDLGDRWRVNPNVDTPTFLAELTQRGAVDEDEELTDLMTNLEPSGDISEVQLLDIAKRVDAYEN
ncbi:MAG: hypothetical protein OXG97_10420 [Candidatus Poribacteria bacterium]|nr:hypothetical protein [Candidatus Poribacteria bacterium]